MYLLGRYFQISYHEAYFVRPAWEIENLLVGLADEASGVDEQDPDYGVDVPLGGGGRLTITGPDEEVD